MARDVGAYEVQPPASVTDLVTSVFPSSRSVQVGNPATAFGTIITWGAADTIGCGIASVTAVPANFVYPTTDPATNALIGTPNTPADIAAGGGAELRLRVYTNS